MRRDFVTQAALLRWPLCRLDLLVEQTQLRLQQFQLLLLTKDGAIEFLDQILGQAQFDFQFGQSIFHGSLILFHANNKGLAR